jgi:hypothetical protein
MTLARERKSFERISVEKGRMSDKKNNSCTFIAK